MEDMNKMMETEKEDNAVIVHKLNENLEDATARMTAQMSVLKDDAAAKMNMIDEITAGIQEKVVENAVLTEQLEQSKAESDELKATVQNLKSKNTSFASELENLTTKFKEPVNCDNEQGVDGKINNSASMHATGVAVMANAERLKHEWLAGGAMIEMVPPSSNDDMQEAVMLRPGSAAAMEVASSGPKLKSTVRGSAVFDVEVVQSKPTNRLSVTLLNDNNSNTDGKVRFDSSVDTDASVEEIIKEAVSELPLVLLAPLADGNGDAAPAVSTPPNNTVVYTHAATEFKGSILSLAAATNPPSIRNSGVVTAKEEEGGKTEQPIRVRKRCIGVFDRGIVVSRRKKRLASSLAKY